MDFENSKYAAQFPFPQPQNSPLAPNATPSIDFSLNMLATGRVELKIKVSFVTQPLNFPDFNRVGCETSPSRNRGTTAKPATEIY